MRRPSPSILLRCSLVALLTVAACGDDASDGAGGGSADACGGATTLDVPDDTSARGPWAVGARTVSVDGLTVEVFYPAPPESDASAKKTYDIRDFLPASEQGKVPAERAPYQTCDCADGLPLDEAHGPYPVVVFVHGTAGFRTQSLELATHWASRGFVVLAADHPGLYLGDFVGNVCGASVPTPDLQGDLAKLVAAAQTPSGELGFLAGRVDAGRLGMVGHSAGGAAISTQGDVARVLVPMAAGGAAAGEALESTLVLGAVEDKVVGFNQTLDGYAATPTPRRLVSLSPAGHLAFSSLCAITNDDGEDIETVALATDVCGATLAGALFDCGPGYVTPERGWTIVNDASTAALEERLWCAPDRAAWIRGIADRYEEVAEFREE